MSVLISSLNVRGLRDHTKRRKVFHYLQRSEAGIIFLQETHCTPDIEKLWKAEWGFTVLFSHGTSESRGVCMLFKNNFHLEIHDVNSDINGRYIIVDVTVGSKRLTLSNIYGQNQDKPAVFKIL